MNLRDALLRAAPFARVDEADSLSGIAVVPAVFDPKVPVHLLNGETPIPLEPAYVFATDGTSGIVITLDPDVDVPNVVLNAKSAKKAITALKKEEFSLEKTGLHVVTIRGVSGSVFTITGYPAGVVQQPPKAPPMTLKLSQDHIDDINRVTHVVREGDADRPDLGFLHFTGDFIEATDEYRIARSYVGMKAGTGLIPSMVFECWPKKSKFIFLTRAGDVLHVIVDEEHRFTRITSDEKWFNLDGHIPDKSHDYASIFWCDFLRNSVQQARKTSNCDVVELAFSSGSLEVRGVMLDGKVSATSVMKAEGAKEPVTFVCKGKLLEASLKALEGESIVLFWRNGAAPLRLEASGYTELIWPMVPPKAAKQETAHANG